MAHDSFTLTGTYHLFDGTPARGIVEIIPSEKVVKDTTGDVVLSGRVKVELDAAGTFSVSLPDPRDTVNLNPAGFGYTVSAKLYHQHLAAVSFGGDQITASAVAGVLNIEDVTSVDPSTFTPGTTYVDHADLTSAVQAAVDGLVAGAPGALDTLNELAAALGDDANFAATVTAALAGKVPDTRTVAGHALSGDVTVTKGDVGLGAVDNTADVDKPVSTATQAALAGKIGATAIVDATYGNDATDAKDHFQSKMDALAAAGGGLLFIPRGIYRTSGPLLVPSNVTMRGEGRSTVIKATFSGSSLIYNKNNATTGDSNITVTDLCVDGNGTANQGVAFAGVTHGTISNVRVKGCTGYGIWLWAAGEGVGTPISQGIPTQFVTVSACHLSDILDTGVEIDAAQNCTVSDCTVEATNGRGFYAWNGATDCVFVGNVVVGVGASNNVWAFMASGLAPAAVGIYPRQTARITFVGNTAYNVSTALKVAGSSGNVPTDITLNANSAYTTVASSNGINLDYCTRIMLDGNHLEGFTNPIRISDPPQGGTPGSVLFPQIQNNRFVGGATSQIYKLTNGQINGNQFYGQTNHVIAWQGCSGVTINHNYFANAGTSANANAMTFYDYSGVACSGNNVQGNHTHDNRTTKYLGNVLTLSGAADYNICTGNSARGARAGGQAVQNAGTGVNNVIANNLNA